MSQLSTPHGLQHPDIQQSGVAVRFGDAPFQRNCWGETGIALSPDGRTLAVCDGRAIRLVDSSSGQTLRLIASEGFLDARSPTFTADGATLLWLSSAGLSAVAVQDASATAQVTSLAGVSVTTIAAHPNKSSVVYIGGTRHSTLRDIADETPVAELPFWTESPQDVSRTIAAVFSRSGDLLAIASSDAIDVWKLGDTERLMRVQVPADSVTTVCFSQDQTTLYAGTKDGKILAIDPRSGNVVDTVQVFAQHNHPVVSLQLRPGTDELFSTSAYESLAVLSTLTVAVIRTAKLPYTVVQLRFAPDGQRALGVFQHSLQTGTLTATLDLQSLTLTALHLPRGVDALAFSTTNDVTVARFDGSIERTTCTAETCTVGRFSPTLPSVMSTHGVRHATQDYNAIVIGHTSGGEQRTAQRLSGKKPAQSLTLSASTLLDDGTIWTVIDSKLVKVAAPTMSFETIESVTVGKPVGCMVSDDEQRVAVRAVGELFIVNTRTSQCISSGKIPANGAIALDNVGGGVALLNSGAKLVFFTDAAIATHVAVSLAGNWFGDRPECIAVSPDGAIAAAGCRTGLVHLVVKDPATHALRQCKFYGCEANLRFVRFSSDGTLLAIAGTHPVVRVYSVPALLAALIEATDNSTPKPKAKKKR
jgi:WD40 repeat protein